MNELLLAAYEYFLKRGKDKDNKILALDFSKRDVENVTIGDRGPRYDQAHY